MKSTLFLVLVFFLGVSVVCAQESMAYPWPSTAPTPITSGWIFAVALQRAAVQAELADCEAQIRELAMIGANLRLGHWAEAGASALAQGKAQRKGLRETADWLLPRVKSLMKRLDGHRIWYLSPREAQDPRAEKTLSFVRSLADRYQKARRDVGELYRECQ